MGYSHNEGDEEEEEEENRARDDAAEEEEKANNLDIRPPRVRFIVIDETENHVQQFRVVGRCIKLRIKDPPADCDNPLVWMEAAMRDIHAYIISLIPNEERYLIGVVVKSKYFANGAGGLSFRPIENFHYADLWDLIANLTQSNENFQIAESFVLHIIFVSIPEGLSARRARKLTINSVTQRSIVSIVNIDNLCLPRSLVVGETYIKLRENDTDEARKEWGAVRDGRRKLQ